MTVAAVEKPGAKIRSVTSASLMAASVSLATTLRSFATSRTFATSIPPPSSVISISTCSPSRKARKRIVRDGGLACGGARRRGLDAMVHRIAEHVHERLHEDFDDGLVRLRVFALEGQRYGLAQLGRHLAYQPGKSLKGGAQWQDAHAENGSLQLADEAGEGGLPVLQRHGECGTVVLCELDGVADRVFRDGELAGQPDERIDSVGGYAQCLRAVGARLCGGRLSRARARRGFERRGQRLPQPPRIAFSDRRGRRGGNVIGGRRIADMAQHVRGGEPCRGYAAVVLRAGLGEQCHLSFEQLACSPSKRMLCGGARAGCQRLDVAMPDLVA